MNPLAGIGPEEMRQKVDQFCQEKDLMQHREAFMKGAFLAQNPRQFEELAILTDEDKDIM